MSSEDPWIRINNAFATLSEYQVNAAIREENAAKRQENADKEMAELRELYKQGAAETQDVRKLHIGLVAAVSELAKAGKRTEETVDKLAVKVDALVVKVDAVVDLHKDTDYKINALIDALQRNGKDKGEKP